MQMLRRTALLGVVLALSATAVGYSQPAAGAVDVSIRVLSNRADLVSGGDALLEVVLPPGAVTGLRVDVAGRDVTRSFRPSSNRRLLGLVEGLAIGKNVVTATLREGSGARITLVNHPASGPIFSGPHLTPWVCTAGDQGLETPDEQCNAAPVFDYVYRPTDSDGFSAYDPHNPPDDVAQTTTDQGRAVPYIVRRERGTVNRGLYAIAVLFDPAKPWTPQRPQEAWNGKLVYPFGGNCNTNHNQGTFGDIDVLDDKALSRGFAVSTSTLNVLGQHCNTVLSAETVMMVKEHFVESYGEVRYTMGQGGSGGSIGQQMVSNAYPGLLQGVVTWQTFPDNWTTHTEVEDCRLLVQHFAASPLFADPAAQTAVNGHEGPSACAAWEGLFGRVQDPSHGCGLEPALNSTLPTASVPGPGDYNPLLNPTGCRGTIQDIQRNIWGTRKPDGPARYVWDNEGVQYGLQALKAGAISVDQFVDVNVNIGGLDADRVKTPNRSVADPGTPQIGHRAGMSNDGRQLDQVAFIDMPWAGNLEVHNSFHAQSIEQRLLAANGQADNHAIWRGKDGEFLQAFLTMDAWLTAIEADHSKMPLERKIVKDRPRTAVDSCFDDADKQIFDRATCDELFPYYGNARMASGAKLASDVLKCRLKPHRREDYPATLTDAQFKALDAVFPNGVCDWSQPGIGQVPSVPWMTYAEGPGGRPLGAPPSSVRFTGTGTGASAPGSSAPPPASSAGRPPAGGALPATGATSVLPLAAAMALAAAAVLRRSRNRQRTQQT